MLINVKRGQIRALTPESHTSLGRRSITSTIQKRHPATVGELARMLAEGGRLDETVFLNIIKSMVKDGSLRLGSPSFEIYSVLDYLLTPTVSGWFWLIFWSVCGSTFAVYVMPNVFPFSILHWIFGSFILLLPGYVTTKALFPFRNLQFYERLALSIVLSLAIIPILGFILSITLLGIRFLTILTFLGAYTILAASLAAGRSFLAIVQPPDQL